MKLVYIQSLSRSGSTFLQKVLAAQAGMVSLGEVERVLKNASLKREDPYDDARRAVGNKHTHDKSPCSCGALRNECSFWKPLLEEVSGRSMPDCYAGLMRHFEEQYPGQVLVDSSKLALGYKKNYVAPGLVSASDVRVILLIRDYRAWCHSMQKRKKIRYATGTYPPGYHSYLMDAYRWLWNNQRGVQQLKSSGIAHCIVSHERLVFDFESEMKRILTFLGRDPESLSLSSVPVMHELFGSHSLKIENAESYRIAPSYDPSWLSDNSGTCYGPILYPVARFNHYVHEKLTRAA